MDRMADAPHSLYNLIATFIPNCPDFLRDNIGWNIFCKADRVQLLSFTKTPVIRSTLCRSSTDGHWSGGVNKSFKGGNNCSKIKEIFKKDNLLSRYPI